jgi:hypothetical protein
MKKWNTLNLRYSAPVKIIRQLDVDADARILVIGDGNVGAYEWAIEKDGSVEQHSDLGYGIADIALRDGLITYFGLPQSRCASKK